MSMMTDDPVTPVHAPEESVAETNAPVASVATADVTPEPAAPAAPAPQPTQAPAPASNDMDLFEQAMADMQTQSTSRENSRKVNKGDRVLATVIQVEPDRVFVDLGTKSEGVVPLAELSFEPLETAVGEVKIGDKIEVIVIRPEGGDGNAIVSKKKADFDQRWNRILESFTEGQTISAQVVSRVKGGLEVDLGVRGFVPATHVGTGKLRNIEKYVGQAIELKIIEVDRDRKKVVLSNRLAEEEKKAEVKKQLFEKVAPGDILEGTVRRLADYGAFIDLGGLDGLLHISEMSWMRIQHPREVLKEGQKIKVMVLRLDPDTGKISLGLRQVLPDPWNLIKENYRVGGRIAVTIGRLVQSGAFVKLPEGAEAFLPVSEISNRRISKPADVISEGQEVEVVIVDLRPDERRMVLSMRGAGTAIDPPSTGEESEQMFEDDRRGFGGKPSGGKRSGKKGKRGGGRDDDDDFDGPVVGRIPTGGATIGERLGMLKGMLRGDDADDAEEGADETPEPSADEETKE